MDAAGKMVLRLAKDFPDSPAAGQALNLAGNIELAKGDAAGAEKSYLKALGVATERKDRAAAVESLCLLVELLANDGTGRSKDTVARADRFWKENAGESPFRTRVAVAQAKAFAKMGRGAEALDRLREILAAGGGDPEEKGKIIDAYAEAYLGNHSPEELAAHFENLPGVDPANRGLLARTRMAVISAREDEAGAAKDEAGKLAAAAEVKSLYQKLKADFAPADLDTRTLVRLGDHLRLNTSTPREALPYYDEAIGRNDAAMRTAALLGRADVGTRSKDAAGIDTGIGDFKRVCQESADGAAREYALFRIVEALMAKGDFPQVVEEATRFPKLASPAGSGFLPQVGLMLARAYQELGRADEAIAGYERVWSGHADDLRISAPAINGWMQLLWTRNHDAEGEKPSDRQAAYDGGTAYLQHGRGILGRFSEDDLGPWHEIEQAVRTFGTSPGINPVVATPAVEKEPNQ